MRQNGWSLVEIMVVVIVVGILAAITWPAASGLLNRATLTATTTEFISAIHLARNSAVKHGDVSVLCPTSDGRVCDEDADYVDGWLVTTATNDSEETLRSWPATRPTLQVNYPGDQFVRFGPDGLPRQSGGAFLAGTARFCLGGEGRRVILSRNGRVRVVDDEC